MNNHVNDSMITDRLNGITKQICTTCGRKRMYFCYECRQYMPMIEEAVPKVQLPVQIDILKHAGERNSKSTALHCLLLASENTSLYEAPNVPDYRTQKYMLENTVLVLHSDNAPSINDYVQTKGQIGRLVFLDSTWMQLNVLKLLPEIQNLPVVTLKAYVTQYWRPQKGRSMNHLATIEAIYYAVTELCDSFGEDYRCANLHDLLFWFYFFRSKVVQK